MNIRCSLIISVYNKLDYFLLVLAGLERQSVKEFEIIVADDGSKVEFVAGAKAALKKAGFAYQYIWRADDGWNKNEVLNKSVAAARGERIIIIDGDCIPHRHFIYWHLKLGGPKIILSGRRVNLNPTPTKWLTPERVRSGVLEWGYLFFWPWQIWGYYTLYFKGWYLPFLDKIVNRGKRRLLGCNMSMQKSDLLSINGFDERYRGPGTGEDSDIDFRLKLIGCTSRGLANLAVQYHLYHKELKRPNQNEAIFEEVKASGQAYTPYGIVK